MTIRDGEARPRPWNTGIDEEPRVAQPEPENPLEPGPVHPPRCAGVPGPPPAADVRRFGIDVPRDDVGLDLVAEGGGWRTAVMDRVHECEELGRFVAITLCGERNDRPDSGVGVLPAIFPDTGRIALDVAGFQRRAVERRREKEHEAVPYMDYLFIDRGHGLLAPRRVGAARDHAPRLRDRIDAARIVDGGPERRPVVEVRAPIPSPVPGLSFERFLQRARVASPRGGAFALPARFGHCRPFRQDRMEEPGEPDTLPLSLGPHEVHPVVPVPCSHQRETMAPDGQAAVESSGAMFEHRGLLLGAARLQIRVELLAAGGRPFEEGHDLVEEAPIAGGLDILLDDVGKPEAIVGDPGPHSPTGRPGSALLDVAPDGQSTRCPE